MPFFWLQFWCRFLLSYCFNAGISVGGPRIGGRLRSLILGSLLGRISKSQGYVQAPWELHVAVCELADYQPPRISLQALRMH